MSVRPAGEQFLYSHPQLLEATMRSRGFAVTAVCFCLLGALPGCGKADPLGRRAVSGLVTLNGTPLEQGSISFQPTEQGHTSSGAVISQGRYAITKEQGLPPGRYRVVITAVKPGTGVTLPEGGMPGEETGTPPVELIPPDWNAKSENFVVVDTGGSTEFTHAIVANQ